MSEYKTLNYGDIYSFYKPFRLSLYDKGFEHISDGSFRSVLGRNNIVIKIPIQHDGIMDNIIEAKAWHTYRNKPTKDGIYLAPSRLLPNYCLMMPLVEIASDTLEDYTPAWVHRVDAHQVGWYKGRLVAYDYASNLIERSDWEKDNILKSEFFFSNNWKQKWPELFPDEIKIYEDEDICF